NFGSFFATLLMPVFLDEFGPSVAFGIPGLLMFVATLIFWLGRRDYVHVPPAPPHPDSFLRVAGSALMARGPDSSGRPGLMLAGIGGAVALGFVILGFVDLGRMVLTHDAPLLGVAQWWCL